MEKRRNYLFLILIMNFLTSYAQTFSPAKPSLEQLKFQDMELGVFIHYSIDAYAGRDLGPGETPASAFNPTNLNVDQWVSTAKDMGAKFVVLTARHEQRILCMANHYY
jgi:alpha-L-fucosidase